MFLLLKPLIACLTFISISICILLISPYNNILNGYIQKQSTLSKQEWNITVQLDQCDGKRIYMYDLPLEFNSHILSKCGYKIANWLNYCNHLKHHGYGEHLFETLNSSISNNQTGFNPSLWYRTDSYMLEVIFHHKMLSYPCLTNNSDVADGFYLPYYAGLDALDYLYNLDDKPKDKHGTKLVSWIESNPIARKQWEKFNGKNHFLVLGRTPWDFIQLATNPWGWGTGILKVPHFENMTLLLIEKQPWARNQQAIPYPTSFHPSSSSHFHSWINSVRMSDRPTLFSFVGSIRPNLMKDGIRHLLLDQCSSSSHCKLLDCKQHKCSHNPIPIIKTFLQSQFCLQPRGDTPTRRSLFDALISGCIPVLFHNDTAYSQYTWHIPGDVDTWSVFISEEDIKGGSLVEDILLRFKESQVLQMRRNVVNLIPHLIYSDVVGNVLRKDRDAFAITIDGVLRKFSLLKKHHNQTSTQ